MSEIASRIRTLRLRLGLSQIELARAVGVSKQAMCQWEKGTNKALKGENLLRLASALKVDPAVLLRGDLPAPGAKLDPEVQDLMTLFASLSAKHRKLVLHIIRELK